LTLEPVKAYQKVRTLGIGRNALMGVSNTPS
jgi:hypothetical protein